MAAYLDAASGAPLHPVAREALLAALDDGWADPGRLYGAGRRARLLLDAARESMAESLGARPDEVSFPAGGTQALHAAVLGTLPCPDGRDVRAQRGRALRGPARRRSARRAGGRPYPSGSTDTAGLTPTSSRRRRGSSAVAAARAGGQPRSRHDPAGHASRGPGPPGAARRRCDADARPRADSGAAGRCSPATPAPGVVRPVSACWPSAPAFAGVRPTRQTTARAAECLAFPTSSGSWPPQPPAGAVQVQQAEAARLAALIDRIRVTVPATVPDVEVLGDPRRPAAAHRHVLLPVRRRRGAADRAGPARVRRVVRIVVHLVDAEPVARAGRDGRADVGQRPGLAAPRDDRG